MELKPNVILLLDDAPQFHKDMTVVQFVLHIRLLLQSCRHERSFSCAGPRAWNSLPSSLQELTDTKTFKCKLKTFLFQQAYHWTCVVLFVFVLFLFYFSTRHVIRWSILFCKQNSLWTMNFEKNCSSSATDHRCGRSSCYNSTGWRKASVSWRQSPSDCQPYDQQLGAPSDVPDSMKHLSLA